tara:strand:- start:9165 stop:10433 length:1269 start_codon:yes stop_codon:yes gene_type:complete
MKKIVLLLVLFCSSMVFVQCNIDDSNPVDEETVDPEIDFDNAIVIDVVDDYFSQHFEIRAYLSDKNGTIVAEEKLSSFNKTILTADFENNEYDLTLLRGIPGSNGELQTFLNIEPTIYTLKLRPKLNPNFEAVNLEITNAVPEFYVTGITGDYAEVGYTNENGGTFLLKGLLEETPGDFFALGKMPDEEFPRYFWREDVPGNSTIGVNMLSLPFAEKSITTQFPDNYRLDLTITGHRDEDESDDKFIKHTLLKTNFTAGTTSNQFYIPENLFDNYEFATRFSANSAVYFYLEKSPQITNIVTLPNFDVTINSSGINNFSMTSTGKYDFFEALYTHDITDSILDLRYSVFGEFSENTSFKLKTLFDSIFSNTPTIASDKLEFQDVTVRDYDVINSFSDISKTYIGGLPDFPKFYTFKGVTRYE